MPTLCTSLLAGKYTLLTHHKFKKNKTSQIIKLDNTDNKTDNKKVKLPTTYARGLTSKQPMG